ncbi:MAG TPA: hypothetical protein VF044_09055 [Actinomycetota bacterium]
MDTTRSFEGIKRGLAALVLGIAAALPAAIWATPARAAITGSFRDGVLTITGTAANDTIQITCDAGDVRLNGAALPGADVPCDGVQELRMLGRGGDDDLDASSVYADEFASLTRTRGSGGPGDDALFGWERKDVLLGGGGRDSVNGYGGVDVVAAAREPTRRGSAARTPP